MEIEGERDTHSYIYIYIYIHTYTYIYIYIYTHIYMYVYICRGRRGAGPREQGEMFAFTGWSSIGKTLSKLIPTKICVEANAHQ